MEDVKVYVARYGDRKNLMMRYTDPVTGKLVARSTGTTSKREAERISAKWEAELQEGRYQKPLRITWEEFRDEHDRHVLSHMKATTARTYDGTFNLFERFVGVKVLSTITTAQVSAFATALRNRRRSRPTS